MDNSIVISTPPHVKTKQTTKSIMLDVVIALFPCAICGLVYFGWQALMLELVAVASCVASEFVYFFIANKGFSNKCRDAKAVCLRWWKQFDLTSIVTGLILALILPPATAWYVVIIGSIFAIAVVKMFFGGTGKNLVNPAATGRVFAFLCFAAIAASTAYTAPNFGTLMDVESSFVSSSATNLAGLLPSKGEPTSNLHILDLFLGTGVKGCIGETCKLAIIVGYIYLCVRNVIKWWQPLLFTAVFGLTAWLMGGFFYETYTLDIALFLPNILSGGVLFAAVFMFTDYVTSPKGVIGQIVYLIVSAIVLALLRYYTHIEVASFVILLMNLFIPYFDKFLIRKPFGFKREKVQKEGK